MGQKLPYFQFYPGDWMKDPALRACSLSAKGLWIDLICLMFECDQRGQLQINGEPMSAEQLARSVGCDVPQLSQGLDELERCGVLSKTENGVVYSRRMIRDEEQRKAWREKKRVQRLTKGGSPKTRPSTRPADVPPPVPAVSPRSSSSSSSLDIKTPRPPKVLLDPSVDTPAVRAALADWIRYRKQLKPKLTEMTIERLPKRIAKMGAPRFIASVEYSIDQAYKGIIDPDGSRSTSAAEPTGGNAERGKEVIRADKQRELELGIKP